MLKINHQNNLKDFRIYVANTLPPPSAVFRYAEDIVKACNPRALNIDMVLDHSRWPDETGHLRVNGSLGNHYIFNSVFSGISMRSFSKQLNIELDKEKIVHYAHESVPPVSDNIYRSVVTIHENPFARLNTDLYSKYSGNDNERMIKIFRRRLYKKYARFPNLIANTEYVKKSLIEYGFEGNIKTINPAVSSGFFHIERSKPEIRKELNLPIEKKLILSVSSNVKRKNLGTIAKLQKVLGIDFKIVSIGYNLEDSINLSHLTQDVLNKVYNACDLLLYPSLEEGFGYPVVEAFVVGLPVVASNIDPILETSGNAAITVDPMNVGEIKSSINDALSIRSELIKRGFSRAGHFTIDRFRKDLLDFYGKIIKL